MPNEIRLPQVSYLSGASPPTVSTYRPGDRGKMNIKSYTTLILYALDNKVVHQTSVA